MEVPSNHAHITKRDYTLCSCELKQFLPPGRVSIRWFDMLMGKETNTPWLHPQALISGQYLAFVNIKHSALTFKSSKQLFSWPELYLSVLESWGMVGSEY